VEKIVFLQVVPYIAGSGESVLTIVNTATAELAVTVRFIGADGAAMRAAVGTDSARATHEVKLAGQGVADLRIRPANGGSIWIYADQAVSAFLRTALPDESGGIVPAGPLFDAFTLPVEIDRQRGTTTGFAVANNGVTTAMNVWLHIPAGPEVEANYADIASGGQVTRFLHDLFPRYDPFVGKVIVQGGPLAGVGVLIDQGRMSVAPPMVHAGLGPWLVPRIVAGGGTSTAIRVFGSGIARDTVREGRIAFYDSSGRPLVVDVVGAGPVTEVPFRLTPNESMVVTTVASGQLLEGAAVITSGTGRFIAMAGLSLGQDRRVETAATRGHAGFVGAVRRDQTAGLTTVIALSAADTAATVELVLRSSDGQQVSGGIARVSVPAHGHLAQPLERLFPSAAIGNFRGSIEADVSGGKIGATLVELGAATASLIPLSLFP
jgi:hypothetical protein